MTETTALTVQQRAEVALGMKDIDKTLIALASQSKTITAITNNDGYEQCRAARISLKNQRVEIEKKGKSARDDANAFSKAVIAEEKRLISIIEPEELRLKSIQEAHEAKLEAEKQARIADELRRVTNIQHCIDLLKGNPSLTSLSSPDAIQKNIDEITATVIDDTFEEFKDQASVAKIEGIAKLTNLHAAAVARVVEEARIKTEREELARLRSEQEERDRKEKARRDEEDRKEREAREAELAAEREKLRVERDEIDRIKQEQTAAQARIDEENARLAALQNEHEPIQGLDVVDNKDQTTTYFQTFENIEMAPLDELLTSTLVASFEVTPTDDEIIKVICDHFKIDQVTATSWIRNMEIFCTTVA